MMSNNRVPTRAWRLRALAQSPVYLALMAVACSSSSGGGSSTGGTVSSSGGSASGGKPSAGGSGSGGTSSSGGAASGGTSSSGGAASGGAPGTGGSGSGGKSSGSGGGSGGASTSPTTGAGGTAGSTTGASGGASAGGSTGAGGGTTAAGTPSAGCGKTSTLTFGNVPNENASAGAGSGNQVGHGEGGWLTIQSNDAAKGRGFAVRLPDNYDKNKPYWLIFGFHWRGGTADQVDNGGTNGYWWAYYGMQRKSNNGAIFVAPQGNGGGWSDPSDLTFVDDMVKVIEDNYCVDTSNLVTMGFSWGAGMSYALACARAKVFRAAVLYEAGVLSGCEGGNDPIAYMMIEGLTDGTLPITGSYSMRDKFVKNNGCTPMDPSLDCTQQQLQQGKCPATATEPPSPSPYLNPGGHICTDYAGCKAGYPLRWCVSQSDHGPGPIDGTADLYNSCATPPKTCSTSCACTWTPDDVWPWLTGQTITGQTPNATK